MSLIENSTLAIVGAGSVGTATAYAAMIRGSARHVRLYDIDAPRVEAEVLDLAHGSQFTGSSDIDGGADLRHVEGADVVVITAGAKQRPGQTRLDLAGTNVEILRNMLPRLLERAPDAVYLLVTNPCDVLTVAAQQITGLPSSRVFSSGTVLDTARLRWKLAQRAGVAQSSVHAHMVGEHGDTEFPLWSAASIGVTPLLDWEREGMRVFDAEELETLSDQVRNAAYQVIAGKGATNYAIGLSAARIVEAVLSDEHAILPVSSVLEGFLGINGVALSIPSVVSAGGVRPVTTTPFSAEETEALRDSAQALAKVQAALRI
ncbi:L-lactate dehydrogenase [Nesterenkonia sp. E16_7]|uniref:L-lactate dehydrogenase n=1 Tax=unclassified Nesterenkonia TaxID=2629769 RepID=UPI001A92DCD3|nr:MULTISPECIES: L-lactate dehydrogenase [unclassified Nesterenkonia]MBO0596869.1 L-lactate dehydrogenase [Nesterenkonia sp. E16_10]MBO0598178.1 L-lactate dehydrogenase [Nesterenkonia sp. E16_7]